MRYQKAMLVFVFFVLTAICSVGGAFLGSSKLPTQDYADNNTKVAVGGMRPWNCNNFYVNIFTIKGNGSRCCENCLHKFNVGETIELTCGSKHGAVMWTDDNGFDVDRKRNKITLRITPDEEDHNLNLTCKNDAGFITAHLVARESYNTPGPGEVKYLKVGGRWKSDRCYGIAHYPSTLAAPYTQSHRNYQRNTKIWTTYDTHEVITSFNETLNGTVFYCIKYNNLQPDQLYKGKQGKQGAMKQRVKKKYTIYLSNSSEITQKKSGDILNTEKEETENLAAQNLNDKGNTHSSTDLKKGDSANTTALVGGVLGAIILLLLAALSALWYKTKRQREPDDDATEVVYAEIDETPVAPDPPPRNAPITKIEGSLTPKPREQPTDDPYVIVTCQAAAVLSPVTCQTEGDPSPVTCQTKDDPFSPAVCQAKDDPFSPATCQAKDDQFSPVTQVKDNPFSTYCLM